jgi:hypothetical protein
VAELRWFPATALPGPDELAFTTVEHALAAWAAEQEPRAY